MRKSVLAVLLLFVLGAIAHGQVFSQRSDNFAFNQSSVITSWNGSDPANPPYPYNMGSVNLSTQSGISIPFELGYLNDGDLNPCDSIAWGIKVWHTRPDGTLGDGTKTGDAYVLSGSTTCPYFTGEYFPSGNSQDTFDGFSVVTQHVITIVPRACQRYQRPPCVKVVDSLQGGTGTATQTVIE